MSIVVTGATGKLGRHVIEGLLKRVPAADVIAAVRNPEKAADLAARGIVVRHADYAAPETLHAAFAGAEKLLLISSNEVGQRAAQHRTVIAAAASAGVGTIAYTSILRADTSTLALAAEHLETELAIRASSLKFTFLRNGWYLENHTEILKAAVQHGAIAGAAGIGKFASASRADYAAAAVTVLTTAGHDNAVYELAGDTAFTLAELASEVSHQAGKPVAYGNLPPEQYTAVLEGLGIPPGFVAILVDSDLGASRGELDSTSRDLQHLIGRATTTLAAAVAAGLKTP
jgi:NAD(P)H dehydrogenase (quinone)